MCLVCGQTAICPHCHLINDLAKSEVGVFLLSFGKCLFLLLCWSGVIACCLIYFLDSYTLASWSIFTYIYIFFVFWPFESITNILCSQFLFGPGCGFSHKVLALTAFLNMVWGFFRFLLGRVEVGIWETQIGWNALLIMSVFSKSAHFRLLVFSFQLFVGWYLWISVLVKFIPEKKSDKIDWIILF